MSASDILIQIIGGICLLLWGVGMVNKGLNDAFGGALRRVISRSTSNRIKAFFAGLGIATVLQSSTAASLIVSSFAARSVITVPAALAVMLGADVGTTLAAQIMAMNIAWLLPVAIAVGYAVNRLWQGSLYRHIGRAFIGIGLALLSLKLIGAAAEPLKHSEALQVLIEPLNDQPLLAVLLSALLTWAAHSSLSMVLLYVSFAAAGTIPVQLGIYLVLGANLGGVIAPVVLSLRDIPLGRRVPLGNLFTRTLGVLLVMPFMKTFILPYIAMLHPDPGRILVNFHTLFNIGLAVVFLPFIGPLTRLSEAVLPDKAREEDESLPRYLDPGAVSTPAEALAGVSRETLRLSDILMAMLRQTLDVFKENDPQRVQEIAERERTVDSLYDSIKTYLARLPVKKFNEEENRRYLQILTFSTNLEHIGDILDKSLLELAMKKIRNRDSFSEAGFTEIADLHARVLESLQLAQNVFMTGDIGLARRLFEEKASLRSYEMRAIERHFKRLSEGVAETIATSSLHLDILRDLRRINSHIALIAYPILEEAKALNPQLLKPMRPPKGRDRRSKAPTRPAPDTLPEKF